MQALKNLFSKKQTQKIPDIQSTFDHSKISSTDDVSQCPFMKNKKQKMTEEPAKQQEGKCPYKGKEKTKTKKDGQQQVESSSDQQQIPRGGCPFMGGSQKKRNPDLFQMNQGYDEPFVSKFHYYLSANKIDFSLIRRKKNQQPITKSREIFNTYPIYLQHSLFFNGQDYKKVRGLECCSRFLPYEKLRQKGNKYFNKGKYQQAIDYYERALSLFRWLQYFEQDNSTQKTLSHIPSQQSIESAENISMDNESKVHINLKNSDEQEEDILGKDDQFDEMRTKYKEFFVVYTDGNTKLCDGQEMDDAPDIDMRKSLMLQVLLNMAAAYCHLNHYSVALQCIEDCFGLSDKVSQIYLRKAQTLIFNKGYTLQDAQQAKRCIEKALQLKSTQKIFQSNQNILRMVNLHNAGQSYQKTLDFINQKIAEKQKQVNTLKQRLYQRAKEINQVQKRLISQGKTPYQRNQEPMFQSKQFKILLRMKQKYIKVIQFYTQSQNKQQVTLAKRQIQELIKVFADMSTIMGLTLEEKDNQLGGLNTDKIQQRIQTIKKGYCQDIYNAGKFNFTVMEWAIKQIIKEEREQEELKKKQQQEQRKKNGQQIPVQSDSKNNFLKKASWGLVLIPIAGIIINNFLLM